MGEKWPLGRLTLAAGRAENSGRTRSVTEEGPEEERKRRPWKPYVLDAGPGTSHSPCHVILSPGESQHDRCWSYGL